jgi:hypothetical protein
VVGLFESTMSRELAKGLETTRLLLERITVIATGQKAKVAVVLLPLAIQVPGEAAGLVIERVGMAAEASRIDRPQALLRGTA